MSKRKHSFEVGEYYHIFNRGNSKQKIFYDNEDYDRFIKLLYICNSKRNFNFRDHLISLGLDAFDFDRGNTLVSIGAWVLMPNHFHIYLTPNLDDISSNRSNKSVSLFMKKIGTAYSSYYNKKYNRTGSLFEGKFKSIHVESDHYARHLFSYIHMNPLKLINSKWKDEIKSGLLNKDKYIKFLNSFQYSSFFEYVGKVRKKHDKILSKRAFPDYFKNVSFSKLVKFWLESEF